MISTKNIFGNSLIHTNCARKEGCPRVFYAVTVEKRLKLTIFTDSTVEGEKNRITVKTKRENVLVKRLAVGQTEAVQRRRTRQHVDAYHLVSCPPQSLTNVFARP